MSVLRVFQHFENHVKVNEIFLKIVEKSHNLDGKLPKYKDDKLLFANVVFEEI